MVVPAMAQESEPDVHRWYHRQKGGKEAVIARMRIEANSLLDIEPMAVTNGLAMAIRDALKPAAITFEPSASWTWQHANKVLPGRPDSRAVLWYGANGFATIWNTHEGLGQIVYMVQGNVGLGTPLNPPLSKSVGDPIALNNILIGSELTISSLYWQQAVANDKVRLRVGKMLFSSFFDTNTVAYDSFSDFMSQNFNQSVADPLPNYSFGANIELDIDTDIMFRAGVANTASTGNSTGFEGLSPEHLFAIAELDLTAYPTIGGKDRVGHYRFIVWHNGIASDTGNASGWGGLFNFDQEITENMSIFARIGGGDSAVTPATFSVSGGVGIDRPFGLKYHNTGIAIEYSAMSRLGRPVKGNRYMAEWYWRTHLTHSLHIGPVVQYIMDDDLGLGDSLIVGVRATWTH
jgi:carbohydrate-selective porin OprB